MPTIEIRDNATAALRKLMTRIQTSNVNPRIGQAVSDLFKSHLFRLNSERPNKLGGQRTNFYAQAAKMTNYDVMPDGVRVSVSGPVGFRQRLLGGDIRPGKGISFITGKPTKYLTIPARTESYGKRASEFEGLKLVFGRGGKPVALAASSEASYGRTKKTRIAESLIMYWLVGIVHQKPDPSVIPTDEQITSTAIQAVNDYVALKEKRK
jgi:hypothetical protein